MTAAYDNTLRLVTELILGAPPGKPFVAAIDGRSGSGKSDFARRLAENVACTVIHTDDYYLPMEKRVPDWRKIPCANMDLMRLRQEVLEPFLAGQTGSYRHTTARAGRTAQPERSRRGTCC